jgi:ribosomal protein L7/L12
MLKRTLLSIGALAVLLHLSFNEHDYHARLTRLEALMNRVLTELGIDPQQALAQSLSDYVDDHIQSLLMQGNKIEAIKVYRERSGVGLKEAKDAIDALERRMRGY